MMMPIQTGRVAPGAPGWRCQRFLGQLDARDNPIGLVGRLGGAAAPPHRGNVGMRSIFEAAPVAAGKDARSHVQGLNLQLSARAGF
jgi:hypothetical protein